MNNDNVKRTIRIGTFIFWILITVIPILGIVINLVHPITFIETQEQFRSFAERFSKWAPIYFIGLQVLQVVVTPLSHYSVGYMGGFLFGPLWGSIYNYIGRVIGHVCAFWISRFVGMPFIRRFVANDTYNKYNRFVSNKPAMLFLIYFLPFFPDDEISYLVGISQMRFRLFLLANIFGHVGGSASLAYMGAGIDTRDPIFWILFLGTLAGFPILWWLAKKKKQI